MRVPAEMIAVGDSRGDGLFDVRISPRQDTGWPGDRHFGGAEILFCDGHVAYFKQKTLVEAEERNRQRWNNDNQPHEDWW